MNPYMCKIYNNSKLIFDELELHDYYDTFILFLALKHRYVDSNPFSIGIFSNKPDKSYI